MANKSIQMKDGSDNLYPVSIALTDITSQCPCKLPDGDHWVHIDYDNVNRIVKGWFSVLGATAFRTSQAIITIPAAYRPSSDATIPMMVTNASGTSCYRGTVSSSSGNVYQGLTNTATGVFCVFEYKI